MQAHTRWFPLHATTFAFIGAVAVAIAALVAVPTVISPVNFTLATILAAGLGWVGLKIFVNGQTDPSVVQILYATENEPPAPRAKRL